MQVFVVVWHNVCVFLWIPPSCKHDTACLHGRFWLWASCPCAFGGSLRRTEFFLLLHFSSRSLHKETACLKRWVCIVCTMKLASELTAHGWSLWQSFRDQKEQFSSMVKHDHIPAGRSSCQTHLLPCPDLVDYQSPLCSRTACGCSLEKSSVMCTEGCLCGK